MDRHTSEEQYDRQMDNEESIIDRGIGQYRIALMNARTRGEMADTMPGRWLSATYLERVSMKIRAFINEAMEGKPGRNREGAPMLTQLEPDIYAFITMRTILNALLDDKGECEISVVQSRIAREVREEMQHSYMQEERSNTYKYWMREVKRTPDGRTKQRCRARLKKNFPGLPSFNSESERKALGAACAFLVITVCDVTGIASFENRKKVTPKQVRTVKTLMLNPDFFKQLDRINHKAESLWPKFEPMLVPPRPWMGAFKGGFIGMLGERTKLIRTGNRAYLEDVHHLIQNGGMQKVLTSLNAIQATPWRINKRVFEVMQQAYDAGGKKFGMPSREPLPKPDVPVDIKTNNDARKTFADQVKARHRLEAKRESRVRAVHNALRTASMFVDEPAIWFAHNLDWRGRVYPMSSYLSPQGEDLQRSLLEFADGLALETDEAVQWLAIHGAGCWGYDKVSFEDRVKWVEEHEANIRASAGSPMDCDWWTEADKPWMFLAWCVDWVGFEAEEGGEGWDDIATTASDSDDGAPFDADDPTEDAGDGDF